MAGPMQLVRLTDEELQDLIDALFEVERARRERDNATHFFDAARDLVIAIRHDMRSGIAMTYNVHGAVNRLESLLGDLDKPSAYV